MLDLLEQIYVDLIYQTTKFQDPFLMLDLLGIKLAMGFLQVIMTLQDLFLALEALGRIYYNLMPMEMKSFEHFLTLEVPGPILLLFLLQTTILLDLFLMLEAPGQA